MESQEVLPRLMPFGDSARLHHVGIAIAQISQAGISYLPVTTDPIQGVRVGFVSIADCCVELIEPLDDQSPVSNSIQKGIKLVHICFEVDDLENALSEAEAHGFKVIQEPTPAEAFAQRRIAWVWHAVWGLIELLERQLHR
jgi:methylmalonyl-CoA/ethylmalonyl-CoA epimerase